MIADNLTFDKLAGYSYTGRLDQSEIGSEEHIRASSEGGPRRSVGFREG
jgi:hypothetical protein